MNYIVSAAQTKTFKRKKITRNQKPDFNSRRHRHGNPIFFMRQAEWSVCG
jgi:hypothetical protein